MADYSTGVSFYFNQECEAQVIEEEFGISSLYSIDTYAGEVAYGSKSLSNGNSSDWEERTAMAFDQIYFSSYVDRINRQLKIQISARESVTSIRYKLFDLNGRILRCDQRVVNDSSADFQAHVDDIPSGIYVLQADIDGELFVERVQIP